MKVFGLSAIFGFFLAAAGPLHAANIKIVPNPWVPDGEKIKTGNPADGMSFMNLPSSGEIRIYTTTGELVRHFDISGATPGVEKWYGKNDDNQDVASGVYLWVVRSSDATKTGKLIIIR